MGITHSQLKNMLEEAKKNHLDIEIMPKQLPNYQQLNLKSLSYLQISVDRTSMKQADLQKTPEEIAENFLNHGLSTQALPDHVRGKLQDIIDRTKAMRAAAEANAVNLPSSSSRSTIQTSNCSFSDSENSSGLEDSDSEDNYGHNRPRQRWP